jgi:hypothetical protein
MGLPKGCYLEKVVSKAREELSEDMFCGKPVQRKQIPKHYIQKYGLKNLYVKRLDADRRLSYTLLSNGIGVGVFLLEVFLSHKDYEKRFHYT